MFARKQPKDSSDDEFWGVPASGVPVPPRPHPYGAASAPQQQQQAGQQQQVYYGGTQPQQQQQPQAQHGYAFPSVPSYPGQPSYYGASAPPQYAQQQQQQYYQQPPPQQHGAYPPQYNSSGPGSHGFPYYPSQPSYYAQQVPTAPPAASWSSSPDLHASSAAAPGSGPAPAPLAHGPPLRHAASTSQLQRGPDAVHHHHQHPHSHQPHHPPLLGAHHYQHQQPPQQPQQQQQFVFGHGPASGQQPQPQQQQQVADTPRPQSLVLPPAVAQSKAFVPPRPPSLIMRTPAAPGSAPAPAPATAPVSADSPAAGQQAVPPSPRRSILGAIAGLGKGRRNTDLARHRKGQSGEKVDHQGTPAADDGHHHHHHPTAAETTEPQKAGATKAHLLRNPLLGGGHRNTLQEMLKDKEVEEERRKRRELREKKKEEVKKQNEELKKKELQEQNPAEEGESQQPAEDAQSRRQLVEERARLEQERQQMEAAVEERIKRAVEERLKQQEQQLLQQVEVQMRQQEEERRKKLEEELQKQREEIEVREKLRITQLEEQRKKNEEEARIKKEHEEREREAERLLEEERRKGEEKIAKQKNSLQQSFNAEQWKKEIEAKLRKEMEEEEQRRRQAEGGEKHVWELSSNDIILGRTLGKGAFGVVYAGKLHGKEVAVKKLLAAEIDQEALAAFKHEVDIMNKLRHPNILLFMGACVEGDQLMIVTELMPRGSVEDLIHKSKTQLPFKQRMKIGKDCALGMNWLHRLKPPFLHLDLKLGNLLVDQNWNVKVADFGLSKVYNPEAAGDGEMVGSPFYMAPELLLQKDFDEKVDVYAFGVVLWELYTTEEPYKGLFDSLDELIEAVALDEERPEMPDDCPPLLKKLIVSCWQTDPALRPSFGEILKENTLDMVIIQSAVKDTIGQAFWIQHFVEYDVVGWREWLEGFRKYFGVLASKVKDDDPVIQSLKLLLCDAAGDESVTLEAWGNALQWFGPLDPQATAFLANITNVASKGWFFGDISRIEAESRLRAANKGSFLIRFSASQPGSFTISFLYSPQTGPKHIRINRNDKGELVYADAAYTNLDDFIRAQQRSLNLKMYCPGSTYAKLWEGRRMRQGNDDQEEEEEDAYAFFDPSAQA